MLKPVVDVAAVVGADLALKDAYLPPTRADQVAKVVEGRVDYAACTRIDRRLDRPRLERWVAGGLRTLELGVESLNRDVLRQVNKLRRVQVLEQILGAAETLSLHLVLNVIFGWPGQSEEEAFEELDLLTRHLPARYPGVSLTVEGNLLQLNRGAPMLREVASRGIRITGCWPWASVVGWNAPRWRTARGYLLHGHHSTDSTQREAA